MASGASLFAGLNTDNHAIQNVTNIFSTLGSLIAVVGLLVGVDHLSQAKDHARAQAIYTALKDVRDADTTSEAAKFNLYYALFEQKRLGVFSDDMWKPVSQDIEATLRSVEGKAYWGLYKANFSDAFRQELATLPGGA